MLRTTAGANFQWLSSFNYSPRRPAGVVSSLIVLGALVSAGLPVGAAPRQDMPAARDVEESAPCCGPIFGQRRPAPVPMARGEIAQASHGGANDVRISVAVAPGVSSRLGLEQYIDARAAYKFAMIKGLPVGFSMSAGFPTKNTWVVSFNDIPSLQVTAPADFKGPVTLEIVFMKVNEEQPDFYYVDIMNRATATAPSSENRIPTSAWNRPEPELAPVAPRMPQISSSEEDVVLKRAMEFLRKADVSAARLIYENLANKGSARAAFAMGQTYDPDFLKGIGVQRLAHLETAKKWYNKAKDLGSHEAEIMLSTLDR